MKINVFKKSVKGAGGKSFEIYPCSMIKVDGTEARMVAKFVDCKPPENFPITIVVSDKAKLSISKRMYVDEASGDAKERQTLWIRGYDSTEPFVDHSMDEYFD